MSANVWIVPVNYNGLEDTRKCLRSLADLSPAASVVLVDNASTIDPVPALKAEFPWAHILRNSINGGWAGGNNMGIRYALKNGADFIMLLNNDTIVRPDIVGRLLAAAEAHPDFGVIGPVIRYMDEPEVVMTDGVGFNRPGDKGLFYHIPVPEVLKNPPTVTEVDIVNGCCMMIRAEVFRRVGLIEERFFIIHEESDYCLRVQRAGFKCGVMAEGLVWHKGSSFWKKSGKRTQRYYDTRNLGLLLSRHVGRPGSPCRGVSSYAVYLRYAYHRYCHECEDGHRDSADAVLEGLVDLATRKFGKYQPRQRWAVPALRRLFDAARRLKPPSRIGPPPEARKDLWEDRGPA